jgi:hypothetical protein
MGTSGCVWGNFISMINEVKVRGLRLTYAFDSRERMSAIDRMEV